jgi:hypothetical protein
MAAAPADGQLASEGAGQPPSLGASEALDALQREWLDVLYPPRPERILNGRKVGPFGWVGITADPATAKRAELLRVTFNAKKLQSKKRPTPGTEEEKEVVLMLAKVLTQAFREAGEGERQASTAPAASVSTAPAASVSTAPAASASTAPCHHPIRSPHATARCHRPMPLP